MLQDAPVAAMVAAVQGLVQVALHFVFKYNAKDQRLQPYGLALVVAKQVVVPANGSVQFT